MQVVGGVEVIRQLLRAGLVDELHVDVMPVLLGSGLRLLEGSDLEHVRLARESSACGRVGREPASPSASRVSCDPPLRRPSYVNALSPNVLAEYS